MGLFDKMKQASSQMQDAMAAGQSAGGMGGGMGMSGDMSGQMAYAQLAQKLAQSGVEAPGVVHAVRPTGESEFGGGQKVDFDVSIRPAQGDPFPTTIRQSMLPAQLEGLSEGQPITVRYDPDAPAMALIYSW